MDLDRGADRTERPHGALTDPAQLGIGRLFWAVRDAVIIVDEAAGTIALVNPAAERLLGYDARDVVGRPFEILLPARRRRLARAWLARHASSRRGRAEPERSIQLRVLRKGGEEVAVELTLSSLTAPDRPAGATDVAAAEGNAAAGGALPSLEGSFVVAMLRDVSDRARLLGRLRDLQGAALALAAPVPSYPGAVTALLKDIVARAVATLGAAEGQLVLAEDPAWADLLPGQGPRDGLVTVRHPGGPHRRPWRPEGATWHVLTTGELVWVPDMEARSRFGPYPELAERGIRAFAIVPLRAEGRVLGRLGFNFSAEATTPGGGLAPGDQEAMELYAAHAAAALERLRRAHAERRLLEQETEAAALRNVDRLKDELLTTISHELRTPLTVVRGDAERLRRRWEALSPAQVRASAERITSAAAQLAGLVEDLLDFARMQRGEVRVSPEHVDLAGVLRDAAAALRTTPGGERLEEDLPASLPAYADPARVAQMVANLVENALKYAPEGPVVLRARRVPGPGSGPRPGPGPGSGAGSAARVEVADSGPGIAAEDRERVWEKFYRGAGVAGLNVARGSGVGLAVVKALAEAQSGRVGLTSAPGHGAIFWFELPAI